MIGNVAARSRYFLHMGIAFLAIALIGFSTTFFIPLARGTFESGVLVGLHATRRDLAGGEDPFVLGQFVNILIEMALFLALVTAAVVYRRDGEAHKRLLLLATLSALAPAWLRFRHFLPWVPSPFVTLAKGALPEGQEHSCQKWLRQRAYACAIGRKLQPAIHCVPQGTKVLKPILLHHHRDLGQHIGRRANRSTCGYALPYDPMGKTGPGMP